MSLWTQRKILQVIVIVIGTKRFKFGLYLALLTGKMHHTNAPVLVKCWQFKNNTWGPKSRPQQLTFISAQTMFHVFTHCETSVLHQLDVVPLRSCDLDLLFCTIFSQCWTEYWTTDLEIGDSTKNKLWRGTVQ